MVIKLLLLGKSHLTPQILLSHINSVDWTVDHVWCARSLEIITSPCHFPKISRQYANESTFTYWLFVESNLACLKLLVSLVYALVSSWLYYCNSFALLSFLHKLQMAQTYLTRGIYLTETTKSTYYTHLMYSMHWQPTEQTIQLDLSYCPQNITY